MTPSKVSFSDILRNDYWGHFDTFGENFDLYTFNNDTFKNGTFKTDPFKTDPFKTDTFKNDPFESV